MFRTLLFVITTMTLLSLTSHANSAGAHAGDVIQLPTERPVFETSRYLYHLTCASDNLRTLTVVYISTDYASKVVFQKFLAIPEDAHQAPKLSTLLNRCKTAVEVAMSTGTKLVNLNVITGEMSAAATAAK